MRSSEQTKEIFEALVNARESILGLPKTRASYSNKYIPLDDIVDHLKKVLPSLGLGYVQLPEGGTDQTIGLCTRIIHTSGQWVEATAEFALTNMKGVNVSQGAGSAISYFRRYALCAAFGIVSDEDVNGASGSTGDSPPDKEKLKTLTAIMNKTRPDKTAYFSEDRKKYFRVLAKTDIDRCLQEAEIALEEMERSE